MNLSRALFFNRWAAAHRWAVDKFQWASNQVILLSFTTKLHNLMVILALGIIKYVDLKVKRTKICL